MRFAAILAVALASCTAEKPEKARAPLTPVDAGKCDASDVCGKDPKFHEDLARRAAESEAASKTALALAAATSELRLLVEKAIAGETVAFDAAIARVVAAGDRSGQARAAVEAGLVAGRTCLAAQRGDVAACASLGGFRDQLARGCVGKVVLYARLGAGMLARKSCDETQAREAGKLAGQEDRVDDLLAICRAALAGDGAGCGTRKDPGVRALCRAVATGDDKACDEAGERKQRCLAEAAGLSLASGGVARAAGTPASDEDSETTALAARAAAGKLDAATCARDGLARYDRMMLLLLAPRGAGSGPPADQK